MRRLLFGRQNRRSSGNRGPTREIVQHVHVRASAGGGYDIMSDVPRLVVGSLVQTAIQKESRSNPGAEKYRNHMFASLGRTQLKLSIEAHPDIVVYNDVPGFPLMQK